MQTALAALVTIIKEGMADFNQPYYVKSCYTGDPLQMPSFNTPSAAVIPMQPSPVETVFVGEDNDTETFAIRFYQPATRGAGEAAEVAAGMTKLMAMCDRVKTLLRADPTFGGTYVSSAIKSINPMLPSVGENNVYRTAEIIFEMKARRLWGS